MPKQKDKALSNLVGKENVHPWPYASFHCLLSLNCNSPLDYIPPTNQFALSFSLEVN